MKVLSIEEIQDIELAERYSHGISKDLMLRAAHTAREYHRLREALECIAAQLTFGRETALKRSLSDVVTIAGVALKEGDE